MATSRPKGGAPAPYDDDYGDEFWQEVARSTDLACNRRGVESQAKRQRVHPAGAATIAADDGAVASAAALAESAHGEEMVQSLLATTRPGAVVFDLDYTLVCRLTLRTVCTHASPERTCPCAPQWEGNCEDYAEARVLLSASEAHDPHGNRTLRLYSAVKPVFVALAAACVPIAVASSSPATDTARRLLRLFGLQVTAFEVHAGRKEVHLRAISSQLALPLERLLFFDDLPHNIRDASALGCTACLVRGGLSESDVLAGLRRFGERRRGAALMSSWLRRGANTSNCDGL